MSVEHIVVLGIGLLLCHIVIWLNYFDYISILFKILPFKKSKEYEEYKRIRDNILYKKHVKKWKKIYSRLSLIYIICYLTIVYITNKTILAFLVSLGVYAFCIGILSNKEQKEKSEIV